MNRNNIISENELDSIYDKMTQENSTLLAQLKLVNEDSKVKATELTQMISIINTIQMKIIRWKEIRKKIKNRVNV
jgi:hypothetical protein